MLVFEMFAHEVPKQGWSLYLNIPCGFPTGKTEVYEARLNFMQTFRKFGYLDQGNNFSLEIRAAENEIIPRMFPFVKKNSCCFYHHFVMMFP